MRSLNCQGVWLKRCSFGPHAVPVSAINDTEGPRNVQNSNELIEFANLDREKELDEILAKAGSSARDDCTFGGNPVDQSCDTP